MAQEKQIAQEKLVQAIFSNEPFEIIKEIANNIESVNYGNSYYLHEDPNPLLVLLFQKRHPDIDRVLSLLIDKGADADTKNIATGTGPLFLLCNSNENKFLACFKILLDCGADPEIAGPNGSDIMQYSSQEVREILMPVYKYKLLHAIKYKLTVSKITLLINNLDSVNYGCGWDILKNGNPLHTLLHFRHPHMVVILDLLIKKDADLNFRVDSVNSTDTPLSLLCGRNNPIDIACLKLLLENGADPIINHSFIFTKSCSEVKEILFDYYYNKLSGVLHDNEILKLKNEELMIVIKRCEDFANKII